MKGRVGWVVLAVACTPSKSGPEPSIFVAIQSHGASGVIYYTMVADVVGLSQRINLAGN